MSNNFLDTLNRIADNLEKVVFDLNTLHFPQKGIVLCKIQTEIEKSLGAIESIATEHAENLESLSNSEMY